MRLCDRVDEGVGVGVADGVALQLRVNAHVVLMPKSARAG